MPVRRSLSLACLATLIGASQAVAGGKQDDGTAAKIVDEITSCLTIANNIERLACFDRTARVLAAARDKRDIVVLDREQVRKTNRSVFGFVMPQLKLFGSEGESDEIKQLDSTVKDFNDLGYGRYRLSLADGSIWETTAVMRFMPRKGDPITIKAGILGAYHATTRGRSTAIKRVR
ncbi:hypothetical protein [Sphingomonas endolithica]|uniref:hypothetical protein n=1 Tax=Sphingomonas endolithica TaxID=2972485 RepID=UPI0021AF8E03|nr:hypothetical protein [Sphingomonas sp. ZFBP2030]